MDATKRPLRIPPEFITYAEKHNIFELYKRLLEQLIVQKPDDPLAFLVDVLKRESVDVPRVVVIGPPVSGKRGVAKILADKLNAVHLTKESILEEAEPKIKEQIEEWRQKGKVIPADLWASAIECMMKHADCVANGWILEAFPRTREEALAIQSRGITAKHCVVLDAPDNVLIERAVGKRIDPETGDVYHTTFDWPSNPTVARRLIDVPNYSQNDIVERLVVYRRHADDVIVCFGNAHKTINADQPKGDVLSQVVSFIRTEPRSVAPRTPRLILLGPPGSGKSRQAAQLATKYNLVNISCGELLKQALADGTKMGLACQSYLESGLMVPDAIVLEILKDRLSQLDCVTRGWVLHGYPRTGEQAEQLLQAGFQHNRVIFLDTPVDSILERLTLRATDPVAGSRYHYLYNPPLSVEVKDRVLVNPRDSEENIRNRLGRYQAFQDELQEAYPEAQRVNADQDPHTVFECIEAILVNPLPNKAVPLRQSRNTLISVV